MSSLTRVSFCALAVMVGSLLFSPCMASGIDSEKKTDLPIGAGGHRTMTICGGGEDCGDNVVGRVGIETTTPQATLDVNGTIRAGSAALGASCTGTAEGSFAYDSTKHTPVYCNKDKVWTSMENGNDDKGTLCGMAVFFINYNKRGNYIGCTIASSLSCKDQPILTDDCYSNCPSGYLGFTTSHLVNGGVQSGHLAYCAHE
ncbi:MAG: hypothetical protein PHS57_03690 [Alphaproteobacteria bacterium]|nr:hypothetical protein [Alphaproteobacteria bacterium]